MDWSVVINGIIAAVGVIANACIIHVIGNKILAKSKKELQQMQQEHEKELQERQQNFEAFLLSEKEKKSKKKNQKKKNKRHLTIIATT